MRVDQSSFTKIIIYVTMYLSLGATAETVSTHSTQYVPVHKAQTLLAELGCANIDKPTQKEPYRLVRVPGGFRIIANELEVVCLDPGFDETPIATLSSVTLSWEIPTTRENGSPLSPEEIAGYILTYGSAEEPAQVLEIEPTLTSTVVELNPGFWTFSIQTLDTDGLLSKPSGEVSVQVN